MKTEIFNVPLSIEHDAGTGAVKSIRTDVTSSMEWIGFHGRWGVPFAKGRTFTPTQSEMDQSGVGTRWSDESLSVESVLIPSSDHQQWHETYRFRNLTAHPLTFNANDLGIRIPLADNYNAGAAVCLTARCHAHLWAEGSSAWINAMQMNGSPPHLGIILTQGALDGYSIVDREWSSNDRGVFLVHPAITQIPPNGASEISWTIFAHQGWDDFFKKAMTINPHFFLVRS